MGALEKKVAQYRDNLERIKNLKKQLIDCEISWITVKQILKLSQYEYRKLLAGELIEREAEVLQIIANTPDRIKKRDRKYKLFQKTILDKGILIKDFCKKNKLDEKRIYRALKNIMVERDLELEMKVEKALGVKIF